MSNRTTTNTQSTHQLFVYTRDLALQSDDLAIVIINDKVQLGHFYTAKDKWGYMKKVRLLSTYDLRPFPNHHHHHYPIICYSMAV